VPDHEHEKEEVRIEVDKHEEYAIDAEFADKAARLMNDHTQAVIAMLKGNWKKEREELMAKVEEAKKMVEESKEKMQANEANRRQAQTRASDLTNKLTELEANYEKLDLEKKSLESRFKAMEARGDDSAELNKKIQDMTATIEDLERQLAERDAEIERRDSMPLPANGGPTVEELTQQGEQRDELIERLRANVAELQERVDAAAEELKNAESMVGQVEEFKDKKNAEIASLRQQVIDLQRRTSEFDELRKAHVVLTEENENMQKNIEQLEQTAKQNAEVQNRRSIETGNLIDGLKQQLASVTAMAEDYKRKYNSLSVDGNEKAANFAKITAERDDAKAELKRTQVTLQKKQHEAQAMADAIAEKDRRIEALTQHDIDWEDDGSMPPHPGEDPRQLSLF